MEEENVFQEWCVVELFRQPQIAGLVTEQQIGGQTFMRVEVPDRKGIPGTGYTKMYAMKAIYAITPTTMDIVDLVVESAGSEFAPPWCK